MRKLLLVFAIATLFSNFASCTPVELAQTAEEQSTVGENENEEEEPE